MVPSWVKNAVFYQIYPDRFARLEDGSSPLGLNFLKWGTPPEEQGFQGGNLGGILGKLDYLEELGVNALYLNPIFASAANHRYHPFDYLKIDPILGGEAAFRKLLNGCHDRGFKVVLDGVFNHTSRGFWAFHHILENGEKSPYWDWFNVNGVPLRPYHSTYSEPHNYEAWWGLPALPKLNTDNPGVRKHLLDVARYWVDFGIDGWRLDVPEEIDDPKFWREFRKVVKDANPDAYICGEIWSAAPEWLSGDRFDSVMNYPFMGAALSFFGRHSLRDDYHREHLNLTRIDAEAFAERIRNYRDVYSEEVNYGLLNLIDSHDTARALWVLQDDVEALKLIALFQMTMPGAPCIYYGDEIGMSAGDDPFCREAFPWHDESAWNRDLLQHYREVGKLRAKWDTLRSGDLELIESKGGRLRYTRSFGDESLQVVFNVEREPMNISDDLVSWEVVWTNSKQLDILDSMTAAVYKKQVPVDERSRS